MYIENSVSLYIYVIYLCTDVKHVLMQKLFKHLTVHVVNELWSTQDNKSKYWVDVSRSHTQNYKTFIRVEFHSSKPLRECWLPTRAGAKLSTE